MSAPWSGIMVRPKALGLTRTSLGLQAGIARPLTTATVAAALGHRRSRSTYFDVPKVVPRHPLTLTSPILLAMQGRTQSSWTTPRRYLASTHRPIPPHPAPVPSRVAPLSTSSRTSAGRTTWIASARTQLDVLAERTGASKTSLIISFMVLHELTAGIPWVILFYVFTWGGIGVTVLQWIVPSSVWASLMHSESDSAVSPSSFHPEQSGEDEQEVEGKEAGLKAYMTRWIGEVVVRARRKGRYGYRAELVDDQVDEQAVQFNDALPKQEVMAGALADAVAAYLIVKVSIGLACSSGDEMVY